jgi:hypothetical protein
VTPTKKDSQLRTTKRHQASSWRRYAALSRMWSIFTHTNSTSPFFSLVANAVTPTKKDSQLRTTKRHQASSWRRYAALSRMWSIFTHTNSTSPFFSLVANAVTPTKNNEETPGFQLAQVRGTLAHVVHLHPHQLNLVTLLSGGQCSDAYKNLNLKPVLGSVTF